jgi:lysophospholipase L1-like esterase
MIIDASSLSGRQWLILAASSYLGLLGTFIYLMGKRANTFKQATANALASKTEHPQVDQPLERFAEDILAFGREDKDHPPPVGGTVFVGSSTFTHAAAMLKEYFAEFRPILRAFGGSTIPEINHYIEQTVLRYKPAKIVFYAGTNDIADGHSGERVFEDFKAFTALVHARLPHTEIIFVSMSMAPSRVQFEKEFEIGNSLIQSLTNRRKRLRYVDVTRVMYDQRGNLHSDWFLDDQLHMNNLGYEAWLPIIRDALRGMSK